MSTDKSMPTRRELEEANASLAEHNAALEARIARMERLIESNQEAADPRPKLLFDPFDARSNPHNIKKNPPGLVLSWKNPTLRESSSKGWNGWEPVTYDSEIGRNLSEYIIDPPRKMEGTAAQDNYVRRGGDSVLCYIDENIWYARQHNREARAMQRQMASSMHGNTVLRPGVTTMGDGLQRETAPAGGFKARVPAPPLDERNPSHRTDMFAPQE